MPTAYIEKLHKEGYGSIKELEDKWEEAKKKAEEEGHKDEYNYITTIFNNMVGVKKEHIISKETINDNYHIFYKW